MGGDHAPESIIEGAVSASKEAARGTTLVLVGKEKQIKAHLSRYNSASRSIEIVNASETITMDDAPVAAVRKKTDSSIVRIIDLLKERQVEAAFSAGNTGAVVAAAKLKLRTLLGVERPALATILPNLKGLSVLVDAGANSDCKPQHLLQFAIMGHVYARNILRKNNPSIGLMNIGEEASKGNGLTREVFKLLEQKKFNFLGNIEGLDVFNGKVDVIICDGFVGNVIIKVSESVAFALQQIFKEEICKRPLAKLGSLLIKPALKALIKKTDCAEYGGAPLLGINGVCIIGHGNSSPRAIQNGIKMAEEFVDHRINDHIAQEINC